CDEEADCASANCRKEISSPNYYCAAADRECSDQGAAGYDTAETEGAWLCRGKDLSTECAAGTLCDTWVGFYCGMDALWHAGTGEGQTCDLTPYCVGSSRYANRTCNGGAGGAGACSSNGAYAAGCSSEAVLDALHCDISAWIGVGATSCCEGSANGVGLASDPCAPRHPDCIASRTCADGADTCAMKIQGTFCGTSGFCIATDPDWCADGLGNGAVCVFDYQCASRNCDPDLAGVKRCHATESSCVHDATGAETVNGASFCVAVGVGGGWRLCTSAAWGTYNACTGCESCDPLAAATDKCVDDDANCTDSGWDQCESTCVKKKSNSGNCDAGACISITTHVADGKVCTGNPAQGGEGAPSAAAYCDQAIDCDLNACGAPRYHRGCQASGTGCSDTGRVQYDTWVTGVQGEVVSVAYDGPGTSCTKAAGNCSTTPHCGGAGLAGWYLASTCTAAGACTVDTLPDGCCKHAACAAQQYCNSAADHDCVALDTCEKPLGTDYGKTFQTSSEDIYDQCGQGEDSGWDGCDGACLRTKSNTGWCDGAAAACGKAALAVTVGKVCTGKPAEDGEAAASKAFHCDESIQCVLDACRADMWYRGCGTQTAAPGDECTDTTGKVEVDPADEWVADEGERVTVAEYKSGSVCTAAAGLCNGTDHCHGMYWYTGYLCDGAGACFTHTGDLGCCLHEKCADTDYCRESDHSCQDLSLCAVRDGLAFGEVAQDSDEDVNEECEPAGCYDGFCEGGGVFACGQDNEPAQPVGVDGLRCGPGVVTLAATGSPGSYLWWDAASGGNLLGAGSPFTTPEVPGQTSFWVEAIDGVAVAGGKPDTAGGGGYGNTEQYLVFDALAPFILETVDVDALSAGDRTFFLRDDLGVTLDSRTVNLVIGPQTVTLNFYVEAGTNLRLGVEGTPYLYRNTTGVTYPYAVGGVAVIKGSSFGPSYYFFAYNWGAFISEECPSAPRVAVTAGVDPQSARACDNSDGSILPSPYSCASDAADLQCCDDLSWCVSTGSCYASGSHSVDVDGNGDTEYCLSGTWFDCTAATDCDAAGEYAYSEGTNACADTAECAASCISNDCHYLRRDGYGDCDVNAGCLSGRCVSNVQYGTTFVGAGACDVAAGAVCTNGASDGVDVCVVAGSCLADHDRDDQMDDCTGALCVFSDGQTFDLDGDGDLDVCASGTWRDCSANGHCNTAAGYHCLGTDCTNTCGVNADCPSA
ncbi:MAG: hypothetical protein FJ098_07755, partial [Deltaproteobacteria bacterium]|nr:hypothetical protein [Deltaproteobacteria bacterium]